MAALLSTLDHIKDMFVTDVQLIRDFVEDTQRGLTRREKRKLKVPPLNEEEKAELDQFFLTLAEVRQEMEAGRTGKRAVEIESKVVGHFVKDFLTIVYFAPKYAEFLAEMALAYLVSFQEAFVKEYLETIFVYRPQMLKSGKWITFEEVCSFRSRKALLEALAEKEVDAISYKNIDELAKYFEDRLGIVLPSDFPGWESLREASYRRNLILHNQGVTNQIYCSKVGYPKKGERLDTDATYVDKVAGVILDFIEFTHVQVKEKLKLEPPAGGSITNALKNEK